MNFKRMMAMVCAVAFVGPMSACSTTQNTTESVTTTNIETTVETVIDVIEPEITTGIETLETEQTEIVETVQSATIADNTVIAEILDVYKNKEQWLALEIKYLDLNGDGIDELFVMSYENAGRDGYLDIYDVTRSAEPLVKVCLSNIVEDGL